MFRRHTTLIINDLRQQHPVALIGTGFILGTVVTATIKNHYIVMNAIEQMYKS